MMDFPRHVQTCHVFAQVYLRCLFKFSTKLCVECIMVFLGMFLSWGLLLGGFIFDINECYVVSKLAMV